MESVKRFIINREGIGFFKAILDSYEEIGLMTVVDGRTGEIARPILLLRRKTCSPSWKI